MLKTVETLGVSYVKLSEQYQKKLETESKNLNFPYRSETVSIEITPDLIIIFKSPVAITVFGILFGIWRVQ